jgi:hypothetical protein
MKTPTYCGHMSEADTHLLEYIEILQEVLYGKLTFCH